MKRWKKQKRNYVRKKKKKKKKTWDRVYKLPVDEKLGELDGAGIAIVKTSHHSVSTFATDL